MNISRDHHAHEKPSAGTDNLPAAVWHRGRQTSSENQVSDLKKNSSFDLTGETCSRMTGDCDYFFRLGDDLGGRHDCLFQFRQRGEWSFLPLDK